MPFLPRRRTLLAVFALAVFAPLAACGASREDEPSDITTSQSSTLGVYEFQTLADSPGTVVIDVRTPQEYAEGHLANAINIDVSSDAFDQRIDELDRDVTYAIYCRSGNRSQDAMTRMKSAGFGSLAHLEGGIEAWADAGLPVVR